MKKRAIENILVEDSKEYQIKIWEELKAKSVRLSLKKEWFDLILEGIKKEEYRTIKNYWIRRLIASNYNMNEESVFYRGEYTRKYSNGYILFHNGYAEDARQFIIEYRKLTVGYPNNEWCPKDTDLNKLVFRLHLGKVVAKLNLEKQQ